MAIRVFMPVNPLILEWARTAIGYDLSEAADKLAIDVALLKDWESGKSRPSYSQLKKISNLYKRVTAVFFLADVPSDPAVPKDFRVLKDSQIRKLAPSTLMEIRDAQRKRSDAIILAEQMGEPIPEFKYTTHLNDDIPKLAKKFRNIFGISYEVQRAFSNDHSAFNTWKRAIENQNVLVFQASFKSLDELRGLAVFESRFPLILLNTKDAPKPRTFSLLHELCHLLLHVSGIGNMQSPLSRDEGYNQVEVFCNQFAGECLVPAEYFLAEPEVAAISTQKTISKSQISALSNRYNSSWEVILRRLLDLGKISNEFYSNYREELKQLFAGMKPKPKGGPAHQVMVYAYNGEPFTQLAISNYLAEKISASELSRYLGLKFNLIEKMSPVVSTGSL
jgi:Zn-dependent peptidase ImmA (M78 family)